MTIRTVFWDFGNVLATFEFERFFTNFTAHTGIPHDVVRKATCGKTPGSYSDLFAEFERGDIAPQKFFHLLTTALGCTDKISYRDFTQCWINIFIQENIHLDGILSRVTAQKFLLSNTNKIMHELHIAHSPLIRKHFPFHRRIMSYRVRAIKPEPLIYHEALRISGAKPEESVFIDDLEVNIASWRALGGIGIVYNAHHHSLGELEAELIAVGALI